MRSIFWISILAACLTTASYAADFTLSAHSDHYTTPWDRVLTVAAPGLLANDTAPEGDELTVAIHTAPAVGELSLNADGSFTYQPVSGSQGPVTFLYQLENQNGETSYATGTIQVTAGNKAPLAIDNYYTVQVPNTLSVSAANGLLANDIDLDGHVLSAELVTPPAVGTLSLNSDGGFTFQGDPTDSGRYSFTYRVVDALGATAEGQVHLTLVSRNLPIANPDRGDALKGIEATINVLGNDSDPDGNALRVVSVSGGDSTFIRVVDDQTIAYFTMSGDARTVMLNYTISDGIHEASSTVTVNVIETNIPPVVENEHFVIGPGESVTFDPLANDFDINGLPLIMQINRPEFGTLVTTNPSTFTYTYTAATDRGAYNEVLPYGVWNGFRSAMGQVTIEVRPSNSAPIVENEFVLLEMGRNRNFFDVLANDSDPDYDQLRVSRISVQGGRSLTASIVEDGAGLSLQAIRPGQFSISYWVTDGVHETPGYISVQIVGPTENYANDDFFTVEAGREINLNVFANDLVLEFYEENPPAFDASTLQGTLTWRNESWWFEPDAGFTGETSFTYTLYGNKTATVTIDVVAPAAD